VPSTEQETQPAHTLDAPASEESEESTAVLSAPRSTPHRG